VAVCVPAARTSRQAQRIIGEITAAKQAAYLTRRDIDAAAINSALKERHDDLVSQLVAGESERFFKGDIFVLNGPGPNTADIYQGNDPSKWMENLAGWLLGRRYPTLPLDTHILDEPICEDDISEIFASIFDQPGSDPGLLRYFGSALGLIADGPEISFAPSACPVFPLVRELISSTQISFAEVHRRLAYDVGLTEQVASLYLLLFINRERPEHQIKLTGDAVISMVDGVTLQGTRLTSDLIPLLAWNSQLASNAESIRPASEPSFSGARHHLSVLFPEITDYSNEAAEEALTRSYQSLIKQTATARHALERIYSGAGTDEDETGENSDSESLFSRISEISGGNFTEVYHSVYAVYSSLPNLADDLETRRQLPLLKDDSEDILKARRYITDAMAPAVKFANLAMDRETLLTGLSPMSLTRTRGRDWSAIRRDVASSKARYIQVYGEHHQRFNDLLPQFQSSLATARKKSAALGLLNTITELGAPEGVTLEALLATLPVGPNPSQIQEKDLHITDEPICPECLIDLDQSVPADELARLSLQVDLALGAKLKNSADCWWKKS
jgi:hypothetical protein